jgi:hypothetical protein
LFDDRIERMAPRLESAANWLIVGGPSLRGVT